MLSSLQSKPRQLKFAGKSFPKRSERLEYVIGLHGLSLTAEKILGSVARTFTKLCPLSELAAAYHGLVCPFHRVKVFDAQLVCCNWVMLPTWS